MSTYSSGYLTPITADKLDGIQSILTELADNTSHAIIPKNIRDSSYTLWENIIFKPTTVSSIEYIGIDKDLYEKIYIGSKMVNNSPVMNSYLLNSSTDIFFYNTKTGSNYNTKISILSGTSNNYDSSYLNDVASPYLQSTVVASPYGNYSNFDIGNKSYVTSGLTNSGGDINIKSEYGHISLNGIIWPTFITNTDGSSGYSYMDGFVLRYRVSGAGPIASWEAFTQSSTSSVTYFTDPNPIPESVGNIQVGETFSNVPLDTMIRRMLYPYIGPTITTSWNYSLVETGDTTTTSLLKLNYIISRSATYSISNITGPGLGTLITPSSVGIGLTSSQATPSPIISSTLTSTSYKVVSYTMSISDTHPTTSTSSSSVKFMLPWYFGTSNTYSNVILSSGVTSILGTTSTTNPLSIYPSENYLTPLLADPAISSSSVYNKTITLSTHASSGLPQKYIYFGYPSDWAPITQILDGNGYDNTGSFKTYSVFITSPYPTPRWSSKSYIFYIYVGPSGTTPQLTTVGSSPGYSSNWQFKFA